MIDNNSNACFESSNEIMFSNAESSGSMRGIKSLRIFLCISPTYQPHPWMIGCGAQRWFDDEKDYMQGANIEKLNFKLNVTDLDLKRCSA